MFRYGRHGHEVSLQPEDRNLVVDALGAFRFGHDALIEERASMIRAERQRVFEALRDLCRQLTLTVARQLHTLRGGTSCDLDLPRTH